MLATRYPIGFVRIYFAKIKTLTNKEIHNAPFIIFHIFKFDQV